MFSATWVRLSLQRCIPSVSAKRKRANLRLELSTKARIHHLRGAPQYGICYDYVNTMFQPGGKRRPITTRDVRQTLLETDVEFRSLAEEHSRCETQLKQLLTEPYLSSEDLALETTLKKIKLRLKDQMEMIVARSRQHSALPT
jgi:uncharacterized protein YdcH (DUF465 family)